MSTQHSDCAYVEFCAEAFVVQESLVLWTRKTSPNVVVANLKTAYQNLSAACKDERVNRICYATTFFIAQDPLNYVIHSRRIKAKEEVAKPNFVFDPEENGIEAPLANQNYPFNNRSAFYYRVFCVYAEDRKPKDWELEILKTTPEFKRTGDIKNMAVLQPRIPMSQLNYD